VSSYRETRDQKLTDFRDMIQEIVQHNTLKSGCLHGVITSFKIYNSYLLNTLMNFRRLKQCHFDVLRVMPTYETVQKDIPWTKINVPNLQTEFSISLYNIPPGRRCLTRSMFHLVQLHLNLNSLRLLEVPMKVIFFISFIFYMEIFFTNLFH
jgi:hypothetical protein